MKREILLAAGLALGLSGSSAEAIHTASPPEHAVESTPPTIPSPFILPEVAQVILVPVPTTIAPEIISTEEPVDEPVPAITEAPEVITEEPPVIEMAAVPRSVYNGLPNAIERAIGAVVAVNYDFPGKKIGHKGTGVKVLSIDSNGSSLIISSGHVFLREYTGNQPSATPTPLDSCGEVKVYGHGDTQPNDFSTAETVVATDDGTNDNVNPDISMLEVKGNDNLNTAPAVQIGLQPKLGDVVYYVNFGTTEEGELRNPNPAVNYSTDNPEALTNPVAYRGVVVNINNKTGKLIVATGLQSYSPEPADNISRQGASGGPVLDQEGELVGAVQAQAILPNGMPTTAENIKKYYGVTISGVEPTQLLHLEIIQQVTADLATANQQVLTNATPCS